MNKQVQKTLLLLTLFSILGISVIVFFSHLILNLLWLISQDTVSSAIKLFLVRWLTIPIFGIIISLISFFVLLPTYFSRRKAFVLVLTVTFFASAGAEYFLQISQSFLYLILGGWTGIQEPLSRFDLSFFLFVIPLIKKIAVFSIFYSLALLFFRGVSFKKKSLLALLDKMLLLICALSMVALFFFQRWDHIHQNTQEYFGYMDLYGNLLPWLISLGLAFVLFFIILLKPQKISKTKIGFTVFMVLTIIGLNTLWPLYLERLVYLSNQSALQEQFAGIHAESTRRAFGLNKVMRGDQYLVQEDQLSNTIANNFWQDETHFLKAIQRYQEVLPIFHITSTTPLLLSNAQGDFSPYFISTRESLETPDELWDIKHFRNIFGYGAIIGSANQFDKEGESLLILKDLELNSTKIDVPLKHPQIFFSENYNDYILINTKMLLPNFTKEDSPLESQKFENVKSIPVNFFTKILLAIVYRDSRFFLTDYLTKNSGFVFSRKPTEIAQKILPYFHYAQPRLIYHNQELWWEMDAYASSQSLYTSKMVSTPWGSVNWLSVPMKVFVSAYSGEVIFDVLNPKDPYLKIFRKLYPNLFSKKMMLSPHQYLYPKDLFQIQSFLLEKYHDTNAASFYSSLNIREIAGVDSDNLQDAPIKNRQLLNQDKLAMQQTYTPKGKSIFSAQLIAYLDNNKEKKLFLHEAPASLGIPGLSQAQSFLNQDPEFSRMATLWGQIGSQLSYSDITFYPMKERGFYLATVFLESATVSIPLAVQFTAIDGSTIGLGNSIPELLNEVLTILGDSTKITLSEEQQLRSIITEAYQHYLRAETARLDGNSQEYQENVDKIGNTLQQINRFQTTE